MSQAWAAHAAGAQMFSGQQSPLEGEGILAFRYCGAALSGDPGPCGLAIEGSSCVGAETREEASSVKATKGTESHKGKGGMSGET